MNHRGTVTLALRLLGLSALGLTACVSNNPDDEAAALDVVITDETCQVSSATAPSGPISFAIRNDGSVVNEFEVLAADQLRILGEKENIAPGTQLTYTLILTEGDYYTMCKPNMVGAGVGVASFVVTAGEDVVINPDDQAAIDAAITNYISYVKAQVGELVVDTETFAAAYAAGDDETARALFAPTRIHYERIEPTAEAFGDLDPRIDFREPMATEDGIAFTGFHRIEKDLWPPDGFTPSSPAERQALAEGLVADIGRLYELVYDPAFSVTLADISNGAIGLLDEVATSKITGEEDEFSHTDLWDFQANVEGASVAYGIVRDLAVASGADGEALTVEIDSRFEQLNALLAQYGDYDDGFVPYTELDTAEVRELSDRLNALAEPLSRLTQTILGIPPGD